MPTGDLTSTGQLETSLDSVQAVYDAAIAAGASIEAAAEVVVDHVDLLLTGGALKRAFATDPGPNTRTVLIDTVVSSPNSAKISNMLYLALISPQFNVQK